jgi:hypothetical protein
MESVAEIGTVHPRVGPSTPSYCEPLRQSNNISWKIGVWCAHFAERAYSYRSASTGSSFEALTAGTSPLITPTKSSAAVDSKTVMMDIRK